MPYFIPTHNVNVPMTSLNNKYLRWRYPKHGHRSGSANSGDGDIDIVSYWGMASIRLYTLTVVFVLVEWNNAVFYSVCTIKRDTKKDIKEEEVTGLRPHSTCLGEKNTRILVCE
jgi:hypothetical protein